MAESEEMSLRTCSLCSESRTTSAKDWEQTVSGKCFKMCIKCRASARKQYTSTPHLLKNIGCQVSLIVSEFEYRNLKMR
jgi:hypothetical protein